MRIPEFELVVIDVPAGVEGENQSGLQLGRPRIYGALSRGHGNRIAAIVMHPASNFMGHYLLAPLPAAGVDVLGLNSRYVGNDSTLIIERVIQDLGAGLKYLRERGYERVYLLGNSGGAGLAAFYQAQAEQLTISTTPAGDTVCLRPDELPPADGIAIVAGHLGRPMLLSGLVDPSVIDERDAISADPKLDMYDSRNGPPYQADFMAKYRSAQMLRMQRITAWVRQRLAYLRDNGIANDEAFLVYRTYADPRYLDLSLDANDRIVGGDRGANARKTNYGANTLGRFCTLTSWLSQWSPDSQATGPADLTRTTVPLLQLEYTADASVFPSATQAWNQAAGGRMETVPIKGATHYLANQPELLRQVWRTLAEWMR
jgi:pimeloyl-ACP methyl ester carboxylesterase